MIGIATSTAVTSGDYVAINADLTIELDESVLPWRLLVVISTLRYSLSPLEYIVFLDGRICRSAVMIFIGAIFFND